MSKDAKEDLMQFLKSYEEIQLMIAGKKDQDYIKDLFKTISHNVSKSFDERDSEWKTALGKDEDETNIIAQSVLPWFKGRNRLRQQILERMGL